MNNVDVIKEKEDIEKIKNILIMGDYRNYFMFIIGINSGLRINQICNSKVEDKSTFIFKSKRGDNPIERTQAYRILKNACREAGVNLNFGTHTLRKTFGYHFYKQYKDLKYLQKLFNHSSINTTMEYIDLEKNSDEIKYSSFNL